jgi:hypothetical protein
MVESLVASSVALMAPFLGKASEEAAKTVGKEGAIAGLKLLGWLRDKATGRAKEALEDAEAKPSEDNKAVLRVQLAKLLDAQPDLLAELRSLLPEPAPDTGGQHMTLGDNSTGAQIKGNDNTTTITSTR